MMHTKGPWTHRKVSGDNYTKILYHITPDFNEHLVIAKIPAANDTNQANARLIAAAPELLEDLEFLVEQYPNNVGVSKARETIRKATG